MIDVPPETYRQLKEQAGRAGKTLETFTRELLETALQARKKVQPQTTREVLQAAGRISPLSEALRRRILPGVPRDEVRIVLHQTAGPTLSTTRHN
jgi:hypothetical protein